jgi:hypothetical protein
MTSNSTTSHPDLLHRFVCIPYIFGVQCGQKCIDVQSNDLELALGIRRFCKRGGREGRPSIAFWKLVPDPNAPAGSDSVFAVDHGPLRTLHVGRGTILIYDRGKSEILGFVAADVRVSHLVMSLIPMLIGAPTLIGSNCMAFTNK